MGADDVEVVLRRIFHGEGAVGGASPHVCRTQREIAGMGMNEWVVAAEGVACVARPGLVNRVGGHASADRVQLYIAIAVQQVGFPVYQ